MLRISFITSILLIICIIQGFGQCPEKNGRYPVSGQCDAYIECVDGVAEEKLCPDGLLFNDKISPFAFPCQYPIDVSCENRAKLQPPQSTDECPHQFGYYRLGDASNCGQFMNCASGRGYVFDCPEGLAFNQETYRCDWPDEVKDCDAEAYLGFRCPQVAKSELLGDEEYRFFKSNTDCQHYFICINGKPRMYNCGEGMAFNELINACDGAENVTGCAIGAGAPNSRLVTQPIATTQRAQQQQPQQQTRFQQQQQRTQATRSRLETYCESCPEKNGKFPVPGQCDAYIECKDGIPEEKLCPDGLRFNENLSPDGECQYAPSVNCTNRPKFQSPNATDDCPHQFGFYRIGDSAHCSEYMNCAHGIGKVTQCPEGLAFNIDTYQCDWPDQVADCNAEEFLGFVCPPTEKSETETATDIHSDEEKTDDLRFYPHPETCKKYFVCVNGRPRLYSCGKFLVFNRRTNLCDFHTRVPECKRFKVQDIAPLEVLNTSFILQKDLPKSRV